MSRYSEAFPSPTALMLLRALISKMQILDVEQRYIKLCMNYMDESSPVDIIHAASCLQTDSILITNDKHFDKLRQEKIVTVWNTKEALEELV
jgi:PIN domain nuclease of toxin-antitoxin system